MKWFLIVAFLVFLAISAYFLTGGREGGREIEELKRICIEACQKALKEGTNLDNGPCLLNPIPKNPDWVCDVAHSPREPVDDDPINQCSNYRDGFSHHFIEVDPNCTFIRAY